MSSLKSDQSLLHIGKSVLRVCMIILALSLLVACGSNQSTSTATSGPVSYKADVASIFNNRCVQCHNSSQPSGGLDLSSYSGVMAGGGNGAVISAGDAGNSLLISLVQSGRMPRSGAKLAPDQVSILSNWVNAGALDN